MPAYKDNGHNTWYCMFYFEDWTGQKKKKCGFKTKKEALEWESEFKLSANANMDMKMVDFIEIYFRDKNGELKDRTKKNKRYMIENRIVPYFGEWRMNEITPSDIIQWQNEMMGMNFSDSYLRMLQNQMTALFTHINKTYNRIGKRDVIDTPKTENSVRTIDIPNFLKEEVQEYAKKHYGFPENQRLFPIVARTLQKRLKKYEALTGVKPIRVHDIRHSHVAYLIYQGVEPLIIKERLGHKDIQMTLNTYGHLYPSQQKKVAEMLDNKR